MITLLFLSKARPGTRKTAKIAVRPKTEIFIFDIVFTLIHQGFKSKNDEKEENRRK
jgi:hypothetical protein